ncbi:MAG: hypothetical protein ACI36Y_01145 [Coriobacteriales bacterium]
MRTEVEVAVAGALAGAQLADEELLSLLVLDPLSAEAAHVRWGADQLARRASGGRGRVYAQIGVDMLPCPVGCAFCTLAWGNAPEELLERDPEELIVPTAQVVEYARVFDEAGAHLISLMATAALPFEHFLEMVDGVRSAVSSRQVILANCGDLSLSQARQLKDAGADMAYHAHRLGEGELTRVKPERRLQTMRNIKAAGLELMCGVEPLREGLEPALVLERMCEALSFKPYCAGVAGLHAVAGTAMEGARPMSGPRQQLYAAVMRLAAGEGLPYGCGGRNVLWADAGTNPRGRDLCSDPDFLRRDVHRLRKDLESRGWLVE